MTVVAITRCLNEVDILNSSIRRMLRQVDHVIIGDNSDDGGHDILLKLARHFPLTVLWDDEVNWRQAEVMTNYAHMARTEFGADWVVPFDIDEVWGTNDGSRIADKLMDLPPEIMICQAALLTHCVTPEDPPNGDPFRRMGWRSVEQLPLRKIAARCRPDLVIGHGNHSCHYHDTQYPGHIDGLLGARHYPYRSPEQFLKRVSRCWPQLKESDLPESHGAHMRGYGRMWELGGDQAVIDWFNEKFTFPNPSENPEITYDPVG